MPERIDNDTNGATSGRDMKVVEIDGYGYVGYVEIPSLNIKLPVMSTCDDRRLKLAPCRYSGSIYADNFVIAAHNYRSQFGLIRKLKEDDSVFFTDMNGNKTAFKVKSVHTLSPFDVDKMTSGEYDLTLFTCTLGNRTRITVGCMKDDTESITALS